MKNFKYTKVLYKGWVFFAVNIDIFKWEQELELLYNKLPERLLPCTKYDILSYCRNQIQGVNSPQIYIKVKGCWTGGH